MSKYVYTILFILILSGVQLETGSQIPPDAFVGRIAWSAEGNDNDEDDWSASPMALNIFAAYGLQHKLVHFHYNSILGSTWKDLALSEATWVLANPGQSYIVYSYDCQSTIDLQQIPPGTYHVRWMDADTGETVERMRQYIEGGDVELKKPASPGNEIAIYLNRY